MKLSFQRILNKLKPSFTTKVMVVSLNHSTTELLGPGTLYRQYQITFVGDKTEL